jgi:hypothetical protein
LVGFKVRCKNIRLRRRIVASGAGAGFENRRYFLGCALAFWGNRLFLPLRVDLLDNFFLID